MSVFIDESTFKIELAKGDYVEVKKEVPYESVFLLHKATTDATKLTELLEIAVVKIVSDGAEVELTTENIKKLKAGIATKIVLKLTATVNDMQEVVKKN